MGICGLLYAAATSVPVAILLVMISGFFNSPASVARSVLLQRNTPRDMRGRVFSAYYVMRDVIFLFGMAGAGLADVINVRVLIAFASLLLFGAAALALIAPGLGHRRHPARPARVSRAAGAPSHRRTPSGPRRSPTSTGWSASCRRSPASTRSSATRSSGTRPFARSRPARRSSSTATARRRPTSSSTARPRPGIPEEGGGYRGLSTMGDGDFFGEIAALTGSPRTADVVADTGPTLLEVPAEALRSTMDVPEIQRLVFSTLTSRLTRTEAADLPRLAGPDQEALRDLRTPRPSVEALPRSYTGESAS